MLGTPTASHRQQHSEQGVAAHATTAACHLSARRHERLGVRQPLSGLFRVLLPPRDDDERPAGSRAGIRAAENLTEVWLTPLKCRTEVGLYVGLCASSEAQMKLLEEHYKEPEVGLEHD